MGIQAQDVHWSYNPECVASTQTAASARQYDDFQSGIAGDDADFFKEAQWSADGTCLVTNSTDNKLRTYVLPVDLLTPPATGPHILTPYNILNAPSPILAYALYPYYSLSSLDTTLALLSTKDLPIRLSNTLISPTSSDDTSTESSIVANYNLIHATTERYIAPHSLSFTRSGDRFITGSDSLISIFDLTSSSGSAGPLHRQPTIPSRRKKIVGGGVGMKGIVSALSVSCDGLLAAGTYTRCIGLYGSEGEGVPVSVFSIEGEECCDGEDIGGAGVTQCLWSPCGRYLYVVERKSDGMIVYDVRVAGKKLGVLKGRHAHTNQRLGAQVVVGAAAINDTGNMALGSGGFSHEDAGHGHDVWAGGTDGFVSIWRNPHEHEGASAPNTRLKLHHGAIPSAFLYPFAHNILATCSGQRYFGGDEEEEPTDGERHSDKGGNETDRAGGEESMLKVWAL